MKPATVFLEEMTDRELRLFLERHQTVYIPVGAMEQHGPHSPLGTDIYIPREIARRVAIRTGTAVVAPALPYTLSYPHRGFTGEFSLSVETFMAMVRDLAIAFARSGFRRICFLNGHYDNTYAIAYGCAQAAADLPAEARAFPFNYWDGMRPEQMQAYASLAKGMHAGEGEVSAILAINPDLVDWEHVNTEFPSFPKTITGSPALHTAFFFSNPGSVHAITRSGTWGDATKATAEKGEQFLEWGVESVISLMSDLEKTFAELPVRAW